MLKRIFVLIWMFLMAFPISFSFFPDMAWHAIYMGIPFVYSAMHMREIHFIMWIKNNKNVLYALIFFLIQMLYSAIITTMYSNEFSFFKILILNIGRFFSFLAVYIFIRINFHEDSVRIFIKYYICAVSIYVFASIIFMINMELRDTWMRFINAETTHALSLVEKQGLYVTRFGLMGYSGFFCTLRCTLGVLLWTYYYNVFDTNKMISAFLLVIMLLGNMFYGRSGLLCSALVIIIALISSISIQNVIKFIVGFVLIISLVASTIYYTIDTTMIEYWIEWISEPVYAFMSALGHGQISFGTSGDAMTDMYYLPSSDYSILFGDGVYTNSDGTYYGHTDVGVMRNMLFGGIINIFFYYGSFIFIVYSINAMMSRLKIKKRAHFILALLVFFSFFEFKGDALVIYYGLIVTFSYMIYDEYKNLNRGV